MRRTYERETGRGRKQVRQADFREMDEKTRMRDTRSSSQRHSRYRIASTKCADKKQARYTLISLTSLLVTLGRRRWRRIKIAELVRPKEQAEDLAACAFPPDPFPSCCLL